MWGKLIQIYVSIDVYGSNETKWPSDLSLKFRFAYSSCGQNSKKESLEWFLNIIINDNIT